MIVDQPEIKFIPKGWGFERWIINNDKYCGKLLYVVKTKKCSIHFHKMKDETFYIHKGKLHIYYHDNVDELKDILSQTELPIINSMNHIVLKPGDNFYVPPGRVHQFVASEDTELFEFSTHHEDSDSYRIIKGD